MISERDQAKRVARASLAVRVFVVVTAIAVIAILSLQTWQVVLVRHTQLNGTPLGQKIADSSDRILSCTEPEGQCFKDGQKRTANAVGNINRVIVLAAACSVGLNPDWSVARRQTAIQTCVIERLSSKP